MKNVGCPSEAGDGDVAADAGDADAGDADDGDCDVDRAALSRPLRSPAV
jgi:hypothetical protein